MASLFYIYIETYLMEVSQSYLDVCVKPQIVVYMYKRLCECDHGSTKIKLTIVCHGLSLHLDQKIYINYYTNSPHSLKGNLIPNMAMRYFESLSIKKLCL